VICASISFAQKRSFTYQHYGPEDGLSSSNIQSIKQHQNGLMYMATQNGIFTYGGYDFEKLKVDNLKSSFIRNINFDGNDLIIISNDEGVLKYDPQTKKASEIKDLVFRKNADELIPVDELIESGDYAYCISNQITALSLNIKTKAIALDRLKSMDNLASCIYKTHDGKVLVGRTTGLYEFKGAEQQKVAELKNNGIYSITEDKDNNLILGGADKIFTLKKGKIEKEIHVKIKNRSKIFSFTNEQTVNKLAVDKYNRYWFTSNPDNTLYLYEDGQVWDVFDLLNITPTLINSISKDKNENIWIGTFSDGVYFIQNPFYNNISFNELMIGSLNLKNNMVFAATNNGLYSYNLLSGAYKIVTSPDDLFAEEIYNIAASNNTFYYSKTVEFNSHATSISEGGQTYKFNPVISKQVYLLNDKEAIIADRQASVLKLNLTTLKVTDTVVSFPDYRIRINSMLARGDELFIGTSTGLTIYNLKSKSYKILNDPVFNFAINHINNINGKIYIAHENGFTIYDDKKLISKIGDIQLTAVNKIKFFNNTLWLATLNGLYLCDLQLKPITVYNKSNGLTSSSINDMEFDKNYVCIATNRGISITTKEDIIKNQFVPEPVKLSYYEISEQFFYNIPETIKLNANQNNFTIHFFSPLYNKPNKQTFKSKYDDENWIPLNGTQVQLTTIAGGKHKIQIISSADGINWSKPSVILLNKEIAFDETRSYLIFIALGGIVLVILVSYVWIKQVKKKAVKRVAEEQQINLLKHQAMNSLLSPHFIFNSLTSIQNYINTNNSLMASEYLAKFSRLIRMIIEKAAQSQITLKDEITRLNYYLDLEKERFKKKFDFTIVVQPGLDLDNISIPNMIIQPHAENSIIHGILPKNEHGNLTISFSKEKNFLLIRIEDDGIGLIKAKEHAKSNHKSLGTSTITNILELNSKLYNKKQSVKMEDKSTLSPPTNGTMITITLEL
jgi:ligand-binding sensor domain-containing protein